MVQLSTFIYNSRQWAEIKTFIYLRFQCGYISSLSLEGVNITWGFAEKNQIPDSTTVIYSIGIFPTSSSWKISAFIKNGTCFDNVQPDFHHFMSSILCICVGSHREAQPLQAGRPSRRSWLKMDIRSLCREGDSSLESQRVLNDVPV